MRDAFNNIIFFMHALNFILKTNSHSSKYHIPFINFYKLCYPIVKRRMKFLNKVKLRILRIKNFLQLV